jgi:hypothetical protein
VWQRIVDCLGVTVRVRADDAAAAALAAAVIRSYADTSGDIGLDYDLDASSEPRLVRNGVEQSRVERPIDLVPAFEIDLYRQLIVVAEGLQLHAGAVVDSGGRAIIFAGRSGAGKSTLMRALLARGLRYLSEEYVALLGGQKCRGLARALNIDDPTLPVPTGYISDDYPLPHGTFRMFHPPEHAIWRGDARALAVISIDHALDAPDEIVPLTSGQAVMALWPAMFGHSPESLGRLGSAFEGIPLFRLHTRTPEAALDHVLTTARKLGFES